jgi:hypothetical protein
MKVAIMQPYFLPYIGYFQLINAVDKFVIYDDVNYINRGWVNRNQVLINGKPSMITVPLKEASQNKLIKEIEVSTDEKWKVKMLRTIELSYKKAPFFSEVFLLVQTILNSDYQTIAQLNLTSIKLVCKYLAIDTTLEVSSKKYDNKDLSGQQRILDICSKEGAKHYINPIGGIELYESAYFNESNITINFLKSNPVIYNQLGNEFVPWLSILDVMMYNGREKTNSLLNNFSLV